MMMTHDAVFIVTTQQLQQPPTRVLARFKIILAQSIKHRVDHKTRLILKVCN